MHDLSLYIQQNNAITDLIDNCIALLLVSFSQDYWLKRDGFLSFVFRLLHYHSRL